jgi:nitrogen-specific signal transduction histidine kinase
MAWDVTSRIRAEEIAAQLRQSQKMETVGTLAGGIAHDFNNILSPILGFSELALTALPQGHPVRSDIEQVMKAARRARDLVKQILIFSRRSDQVKRPVQLHLVVNEALGLLRSMLPSNVEISQNVENQGDTVLADASQMHQVVMNLGVNALHAMRETGGVLRIELARTKLGAKRLKGTSVLQPGPWVVLSVIDEGEGMDEATLGRVFEPFFTTKRAGEGTGLGLSVVHGIVHSHGGALEVISQPNQGATFRVYLPAIAATEGQPHETPASQRGGGGEHVLIVDDEPPIVALLKRMLEAKGYQVTTASSGEDALAIFQNQADQIDAVITDQTMSRMSGLELAGAVRALRPGLPIILTTGFVDRATLPASGGHITAVAAKPFDAAVITGMPRKVLDQP